MAAINVPTCEASDKPTPDIVSLAPTLQSVRSLAIGKGERESCCSCAKVRTVAAVIATTLDPLSQVFSPPHKTHWRKVCGTVVDPSLTIVELPLTIVEPSLTIVEHLVVCT